MTNPQKRKGDKAENYENAQGFPLHHKYDNLVLFDWVTQK